MNLIVHIGIIAAHTNNEFRYSDYTLSVRSVLKRKVTAKKSCTLPSKPAFSGGVTSIVIQNDCGYCRIEQRSMRVHIFGDQCGDTEVGKKEPCEESVFFAYTCKF